MRHRLYYLLPDVESARRALDDLLLNRIEERHVHFMTGGAPHPPDLPEANFLHKTDVINGAESGMLAGSILGLAFGFLLVSYFDLAASEAVVIVSSTLIGLLFGGWVVCLVVVVLPNSRLLSFVVVLVLGCFL